MPNVIDSTNTPLNSAYVVEEYQGVPGLILESWGPSTRNSDYNAALDILLTRLQKMCLPYICINVVSRDLIKAFPKFEDRSIQLNGSNKLNLHRVPPKELRTEIGRAQAKLKLDPSTSGGNRTKRILIHSPLIDRDMWKEIAQGTVSTSTFTSHVVKPTANRKVLEDRVEALLIADLVQPTGNSRPRRITQESEAYERDPVVKSWILKAAKGICELCDNPAPFAKDDGAPYLEVHHVLPLSEGGSDTTSNAVALCPNCHMKLHYGTKRFELGSSIIRKIARLECEGGS